MNAQQMLSLWEVTAQQFSKPEPATTVEVRNEAVELIGGILFVRGAENFRAVIHHTTREAA